MLGIEQCHNRTVAEIHLRLLHIQVKSIPRVSKIKLTFTKYDSGYAARTLLNENNSQKGLLVSDKLAGVIMLNLVDDPCTDFSQSSIIKHQNSKPGQFGVSNAAFDNSSKHRDPASTQYTNKYKS